MKRFLVATALALTATAAYAQCVTQTYFINGRMTMCTVCCAGGHCTTFCN
jgi:hypothetical protein